MKYKGFVCFLVGDHYLRRSCEVKEEISRRMFQHGRIGQETMLIHWAMES